MLQKVDAVIIIIIIIIIILFHFFFFATSKFIACRGSNTGNRQSQFASLLGEDLQENVARITCP